MHYKESPHLAVERFHAEFLRGLSSVLDSGLYAVKGGVNLRLCLGSVRCSEDLDIDVRTVAKGTLKKSVDRLLADRLPKVLLACGFSIAQFSSPKQTDTVQRWKATLTVGATPVATKVEFSRRGIGEGVESGLIHSQLSLVHQMAPFAVPHYTIPAAVRQKVEALAGRPLTQARDVFDLHFLFSQGGRLAVAEVSPTLLAKAAENCLSLSHKDYLGQVAAYLPVEHSPAYEAKAVWTAMQEEVFGVLEKAVEKSS